MLLLLILIVFITCPVWLLGIILIIDTINDIIDKEENNGKKD